MSDLIENLNQTEMSHLRLGKIIFLFFSFKLNQLTFPRKLLNRSIKFCAEKCGIHQSTFAKLQNLKWKVALDFS